MNQIKLVQIWKGNIWMKNVPENEAQEIAKDLENKGLWVSFQQDGHVLNYDDKKPYVLLNEQERKQIRHKVTCRHCNKKQFYRNEPRCRNCFNMNEEWS